MITREQIELAFGDSRNSFKTRDVDHGVVAITLLRERIPYDVCPSIILSARHDLIFFCDVEKSLPYLTEEDLNVLADCNVMVENDYDCFALFV